MNKRRPKPRKRGIRRSAAAAAGSAPAAGLPGKVVDQVQLDIDYHIIQHFSRHLYGSPNKAVEELVSNGFDAYAQRVFVYVPGSQCPNHVIVWDDGQAMDEQGLKALWLIAASPKLQLKRVARGPDGRTRQMIGKFGIGKLASYSVGESITHLCRIDKKFLAVNVDYRKIAGEVPGAGSKSSSPPQEPIYLLKEEEAKDFVLRYLDGSAAGLKQLFDEPHWTFALIGNLKPPEKRGDLSPGQLRRVLGNGMPLRPDFSVWVNDESVISTLAREDPVRSWDFASPDVQKALADYWKEGVVQGRVSGEPKFDKKTGADPTRPTTEVPFVQLPQLGSVYAQTRLYAHSLESGRTADEGRSSGFFVMVRGRLVNPHDDKVFLPEPSFGTFYRSQFLIHADGMDQDLLADRERLHEGTPRANELAVVQRALYLVARNEQARRDEESIAQESKNDRLPTHSREYFREPMTALLLATQPEALKLLDLSDPKVERRALGPDAPLATISDEGDGFVVNVDHPYYRSLETSFGTGRRAQEVLRRFEAIAIAERATEGRLYDLGMAEARVRELMSWRDGLFRAMARSEQSLHQLIARMEETSYLGDKPFEVAVAQVLRAMGLEAERDGGSGMKDGKFAAPCGEATYTMTFEAKGSSEPVGNERACVAAAAAHREAEKAEHAVIVARAFVGFKQLREGHVPAIIQECNQVPKVSFMDTAGLSALLMAVHKFCFPLDLVKDVFTVIEAPADKLERVRALSQIEKGFDWRRFLDAVRTRAANVPLKESVPYATIRQDDPEWRSIPEKEFRSKLLALETFAGNLVRVDTDRERITLMQSPDIIVSKIEAALAPAEG